MDSKEGVMVDRISTIPDHLLDRIFSFLHIKDVVKTSILSKRWEYAWKSASNLDFTYPGKFICDVDSETKLALFEKIVDRVLLHHRGSSIKKCAFRCYSRKNTFQALNSWIRAVLDCNVQELYVDVGTVLELPPCLFTCRTLVVLKLRIRIRLDLYQHFDLPSLKTLRLENLCFDESIHRLFSCCPVLEDLEIVSKDELFSIILRIVSIRVPSLKRLLIHMRGRPSAHDSWRYKLEINAPNLESLELSGYVPENFSISFSNCLARACIQGRCASKILKDISHVKMLTLSKCRREGLDAASDSMLPLFGNLTSLQVDFFENADQNLISNLLMSCPKLEVVSFSRRFLHLIEGGGSGRSAWNPPESPLDCLRNLKRVEFHHFCGTLFEESLVCYLLQHAPVLHEMTIYLWCCLGSKRKDKAIVQMQMRSARDAIMHYKTSSATCEIKFRDAKVTTKVNYPDVLGPFL